MKVLVSKLEEYRANEASMKDAIINAQNTCDTMVKEAEEKCAQMLNDANAAAIESAKNADMMIAAEEERVEEARRIACSKIDSLVDQIHACIGALDRIKSSNLPAKPSGLFDFDQVERTPHNQTDAVADEISSALENLMGGTEDAIPTAEPRHPATDTTTGKFANLQFGRNYKPSGR